LARMSSIRLGSGFARKRLTHVVYKPWMRGPIDQEVAACFGEAQFSVDRAADKIRVAIVLAIILPPADRA
jgi:hypothetical protein